MKYLLGISMGPVQGFITSARRSRDLWFGSYLLSEVSKAAALAIAQRKGLGNLIFPAPDSEDDLKPDNSDSPSVANKLLVAVDGDETDIAQIAQCAEKAAQGLLEQLAKDVFDKFDDDASLPSDPEKPPIDRASADLQIDDLLEFYWAALPRTGNYVSDRNRLEALLESRKTTRNFAQVRMKDDGGWGNYVPKSSLDGQRESVIPEKVYGGDRALDEPTLYKSYGVRPGERLDGVGLLKRHGWGEPQQGFLSTSYVAALTTLARLEEGREQALDRRAAVEQYIAGLTGLLHNSDSKLGSVNNAHPYFKRPSGKGYDARLLFPERLKEVFPADTLSEAKGMLDNLLTNLGVKDQGTNAYYALFHADGDHMGEAIDRQGQNDGKRGHRDISKKLAEFSRQVRGPVEAASGCLVYAGGDDILAYLPLHLALEVTVRLNEIFRRVLQAFGNPSSLSPSERPPTLSGGLVIAHHLEPLSDVLEWVRAAEHAAKNQYGRNALAITLAVRGGASITVGGHWSQEGSSGIDTQLNSLCQLFRDDKIPSGAAFELRELARTFSGLGGSEAQEMIQSEAVRILSRKRFAADSSEEEEKAVRLEMFTRLTDALESDEASPNGQATHDSTARLNEFANQLIVAREFARAMNHAEVPHGA